MTTTTAAAVPANDAGAGIFSPDALEPNRAGRLTDIQRRQFGVVERAWRKNEIVFAGICAVIAGLLITSTGPAPNAAYRPLAAVAFAVIAVALLVHAMPGADRLSQDLRDGDVAVLEGAMGKHRSYTNSGNSSSESHYLDVRDQHFEVGRSEYDAAPDAGYVKLYYLPRSRRVVNLERLPDPPLPPDAMTAPLETMKSVFGSLKSHDPEARHEAMAEMAQLGAAFRAQVGRDVTPPPADQRDPRPLAEAIVGTWSSAFVTITFGADGSLEFRGPGGRSQTGRWSVDADGRLHEDGIGGGQAGDAWVAGDTLTLSADGEGIRLQRASA